MPKLALDFRRDILCTDVDSGAQTVLDRNSTAIQWSDANCPSAGQRSLSLTKSSRRIRTTSEAALPAY